MKVLFVCYANFGRSQVAQAYFATHSRSMNPIARGIAVNERIATTKVPSRKLKDNLNQRSVEYVRREFGLDIAEKKGKSSSLKWLTQAILSSSSQRKRSGHIAWRKVARSCSGTFTTPLGWRMILPKTYIHKCIGLSNWSPKSADRLRNSAHCFIPRRGWWKADRPPSCPYNSRRSLS